MAGTDPQPSVDSGAAPSPFERPFLNLVKDGRRRLTQVARTLDRVEMQYRGRSEDRSYRQFIVALRLANQAAEEALEAAVLQFDHDPSAAYDKARLLMRSVSGKHEKLVDYLRSGRAEALEIFSQPFTRLVKGLLPNTEALFLGWKLESYELRVYDAEQAGLFTAGAGVNTRREFGRNFQFLQFMHPVLRQSDLFQHAAFGHELGHPLIRRSPPGSLIEAVGVGGVDPDYANVAVQIAEAELQQEDVAHGDEQRSRLNHWFEEVACDVIGMRLLGPAFALAFVEVTSVNRDFEWNVPRDGMRYPPPSMRLGYLREEMERFDVVEPYASAMLSMLDRESPSASTDPDDVIPHSSEWMRRAVGAFRKHCLEPLLGQRELRPEELSGEFDEISRLIDAGIPPAEKILVIAEPDPADSDAPWPWSREYEWRLILNVARIKLLIAPEEEVATRERACRLATGAIEIAEFQRRARKLRQQYELIGGLTQDDRQ